LKGYGVEARVIAPWVFEALIEARAGLAMGARAASGERIWLYSGNLGRAHEWRTLLEAQRVLEAAGEGWRLVFQGGGPSRAAAEEEAKRMGLARCDFRPYVAEDELPASLLAADVLVVTQKPETQGLLWPSKLALVASLPRAILWVGPKDGAIARDLARLGRAGVFAPGEAEGVARWLAEGKWCGDGQIVDPVAVRAAGLREWVEIITGEERAASPDLPGK
jgi:glycosyltransferase involved in cell wall biosynthesis